MVCHHSVLKHTHTKQAPNHVVIANTLHDSAHQLQQEVTGEANPETLPLL